jgi:diaminopimelate decarboxylase
MERVSKLVRQLRRDGIVIKAVDAGGGLGIDYHAGSFDAAAKVGENTPRLSSMRWRL